MLRYSPCFFLTRPPHTYGYCGGFVRTLFMIRKEKTMIMILMGRSGCGKSSIARRLIENYGYRQVTTCTTRKPRDGETEDAYHFMDEKEFFTREANGEFAEYDVYGTNFYGTLKSDLNTTDKLVLIVTPKGAASIKQAFPESFVVHVKTSMKMSVLGAVGREELLTAMKLEAICARACEDELRFDEIGRAHV